MSVPVNEEQQLTTHLYCIMNLITFFWTQLIVAKYSTYVDNEGITQVTIECISIKEEARYALEKLRSKNVSH